MSLALVAATLAGCTSGEGGGGQASCPAVLHYAGHDYTPSRGDVRRDPPTTGRTVTTTLPACDDSGGQHDPSPAHDIEAAELTGIPVRTAVLWNDSVFVREGERFPTVALRWFRPQHCTTPGRFVLTADWLGVRSPHEVRSDADLRPPYRLDVHVVAGPRRYVGTKVQILATARTEPGLGARDVTHTLWRGGQITAVVSCVDGHYRARSLQSAPTEEG